MYMRRTAQYTISITMSSDPIVRVGTCRIRSTVEYSREPQLSRFMFDYESESTREFCAPESLRSPDIFSKKSDKVQVIKMCLLDDR